MARPSVYILGADTLARNLRGFASNLPDAAGRATRNVAVGAKQIIERQYESDLGSFGTTADVGFTLQTAGDSPSAIVGARGRAASVGELGARAHQIAPRTKKALQFPSGDVRRTPVRHPGMAPRRSFSKGVAKALAGAGKEFERQVVSLMARYFAG